MTIDDRYRGQRVYFPKGWRTTRGRNRLIRKLHRENVKAGLWKMESMDKLAQQFKLSPKTIQYVIYN